MFNTPLPPSIESPLQQAPPLSSPPAESFSPPSSPSKQQSSFSPPPLLYIPSPKNINKKDISGNYSNFSSLTNYCTLNKDIGGVGDGNISSICSFDPKTQAHPLADGRCFGGNTQINFSKCTVFDEADMNRSIYPDDLTCSAGSSGNFMTAASAQITAPQSVFKPTERAAVSTIPSASAASDHQYQYKSSMIQNNHDIGVNKARYQMQPISTTTDSAADSGELYVHVTAMNNPKNRSQAEQSSPYSSTPKKLQNQPSFTRLRHSVAPPSIAAGQSSTQLQHHPQYDSQNFEPQNPQKMMNQAAFNQSLYLNPGTGTIGGFNGFSSRGSIGSIDTGNRNDDFSGMRSIGGGPIGVAGASGNSSIGTGIGGSAGTTNESPCYISYYGNGNALLHNQIAASSFQQDYQPNQSPSASIPFSSSGSSSNLSYYPSARTTASTMAGPRSSISTIFVEPQYISSFFDGKTGELNTINQPIDGFKAYQYPHQYTPDPQQHYSDPRSHNQQILPIPPQQLITPGNAYVIPGDPLLNGREIIPELPGDSSSCGKRIYYKQYETPSYNNSNIYSNENGTDDTFSVKSSRSCNSGRGIQRSNSFMGTLRLPSVPMRASSTSSSARLRNGGRRRSFSDERRGRMSKGGKYRKQSKRKNYAGYDDDDAYNLTDSDTDSEDIDDQESEYDDSDEEGSDTDDDNESVEDDEDIEPAVLLSPLSLRKKNKDHKHSHQKDKKPEKKARDQLKDDKKGRGIECTRLISKASSSSGIGKDERKERPRKSLSTGAIPEKHDPDGQKAEVPPLVESPPQQVENEVDKQELVEEPLVLKRHRFSLATGVIGRDVINDRDVMERIRISMDSLSSSGFPSSPASLTSPFASLHNKGVILDSVLPEQQRKNQFNTIKPLVHGPMRLIHCNRWMGKEVLKIDDEAQNWLSQVIAGRRVAVLSICGESSAGKSSLANLLVNEQLVLGNSDLYGSGCSVGSHGDVIDGSNGENVGLLFPIGAFKDASQCPTYPDSMNPLSTANVSDLTGSNSTVQSIGIGEHVAKDPVAAPATSGVLGSSLLPGHLFNNPTSPLAQEDQRTSSYCEMMNQNGFRENIDGISLNASSPASKANARLAARAVPVPRQKCLDNGRNEGEGCTEGVWMWPVELIDNSNISMKNDGNNGCDENGAHSGDENSIVCLILDLEGIGMRSKTIEHDIRMFTLTMLMSHMLVYNSTGTLDSDAIKNLDAVTRITHSLRMHNGLEGNGKADNTLCGRMSNSMMMMMSRVSSSSSAPSTTKKNEVERKSKSPRSSEGGRTSSSASTDDEGDSEDFPRSESNGNDASSDGNAKRKGSNSSRSPLSSTDSRTNVPSRDSSSVTGEPGSTSTIATSFVWRPPTLLWVLRDFTLALTDEKEVPITPSDYIEAVLSTALVAQTQQQQHQLLNSSAFGYGNHHFLPQSTAVAVGDKYQTSPTAFGSNWSHSTPLMLKRNHNGTSHATCDVSAGVYGINQPSSNADAAKSSPTSDRSLRVEDILDCSRERDLNEYECVEARKRLDLLFTDRDCFLLPPPIATRGQLSPMTRPFAAANLLMSSRPQMHIQKNAPVTNPRGSAVAATFNQGCRVQNAYSNSGSNRNSIVMPTSESQPHSANSASHQPGMAMSMTSMNAYQGNGGRIIITNQHQYQNNPMYNILLESDNRFRRHVFQLKHHIYKEAKRLSLSSAIPMTGFAFTKLLDRLVEAINQDEIVDTSEVYGELQHEECKKTKEMCEKKFMMKIRENYQPLLPMNQQDLQIGCQALQEEILNDFKAHAVGDKKTVKMYRNQLKERIRKIIVKAGEENEHHTAWRCRSRLIRLCGELGVTQKVEEGVYDDISDLNNDLEAVKNAYNTEVRGPETIHHSILAEHLDYLRCRAGEVICENLKKQKLEKEREKFEAEKKMEKNVDDVKRIAMQTKEKMESELQSMIEEKEENEYKQEKLKRELDDERNERQRLEEMNNRFTEALRSGEYMDEEGRLVARPPSKSTSNQDRREESPSPPPPKKCFSRKRGCVVM